MFGTHGSRASISFVRVGNEGQDQTASRQELCQEGLEKNSRDCLMAKSLVIVESPAKAKTINKYLGNDFSVKASLGHIKDLPKKGLGVDLKNDFEPSYEVIPGKEKVIKELRSAAKSVDSVFIATDPDREGEAIG